ncbi:MAG: endolytic transglycosylase MltG [Deltaproteobacteria bacterium]|nr:endolytic transglycosylase MltG [Deltaproteobacteria bacterium]
MRMLGRLILRCFVLGIVLAIAAFVGLEYYLSQHFVHSTRIVAIPGGTSLRGVARALTRERVIDFPGLFVLYGRLQGTSHLMKAGEYEFADGLTARQVYDKLVRGDVRTYEVRIPEGWTLQQIASYVAAQPFATSPKFGDEFIAACRDPARIAKLGIVAHSLEGFLFPSTYYVQRPKSAAELVDRLTVEFERQFDAGLRAQLAARGLSLLQLVTLASIIERETGAAVERPLVSAVFHNRLKVNMPLASDPTVIYGLPKFEGNIRRADLENPHPYNTYIHAGLPPGPIANPGRAALEAALNPAAVDYLFFVSKNDGTHFFSTKYADHAAAVDRYQRRRAAPSGP